MSDFIAAEDAHILSKHELDSFEALWDLRLVARSPGLEEGDSRLEAWLGRLQARRQTKEARS